MKITAIVLAKNEESVIERALRSVRFCDEILLIDDFSADKTAEIAKKHKAKVLQFNVSADFAAARNYAEKEARGEWLLFIDADEKLSEGLSREVQNAAKNKEEITAYYIKRRDYWWGRELKHGDVLPARELGIIRLMKKNSGTWAGSVHEVFTPTGSTAQLSTFLNHYPHPTIAAFLGDINFYSTLRAKELKKRGRRANIVAIVFVPLGKFIQNYFMRRGFLDGAAGFAYAFAMSFHSFLVRAKLYQYTKLR